MTTHRPKPSDGRCRHCGRPIHFVETVWLVPIGSIPNDTRSPGFWRHNPRRSA